MSAAQASPTERRVARLVALLAALAGLAYLLAIAAGVPLAASGVWTWGTVLVSAGLVTLFLLSQAFRFDLEWRGHWLTANLDEIVLFLALVALPGPTPVLVVPLAEGIVHVVSGRERVKGLFNVAHIVLATAAAALVFAAASSFGAPALLAASLAIPAYVATSDLQLSLVFAVIEGERPWRVYRERLGATTVILSTLGIAGGLLVVLLARIHPLAVVLLVPFMFLLKRDGELASRADREARVHRLLADASLDLAGGSDLAVAMERTATTCATVLGAGRVVVRLDGETPEAAPFLLVRDFDGGPAASVAPLLVPIPGRGGTVLGSLAVWPRASSQPWGETEAALVRGVAGQAGTAAQGTRAFLALEAAHAAALEQQERLAKQEKLSTLGAMLANVAHEVGNPISYMRLALETSTYEVEKLSASDVPEVASAAERLKRSLGIATRGANNVAEISNSLRRVARQGPEGYKPVDLDALAADVATVVRVGSAKNVHVSVELGAKEARVSGHAGELTQVLLNLVKNAAEAIGSREGNVLISTHVVHDSVVVTVADDGPGIPPDVVARLFKPFFTTKTTGTGLGLNICRTIVRAHGGDISCESQPGTGTTFIVSLPILGTMTKLPDAASALPPDVPGARP